MLGAHLGTQPGQTGQEIHTVGEQLSGQVGCRRPLGYAQPPQLRHRVVVGRMGGHGPSLAHVEVRPMGDPVEPLALSWVECQPTRAGARPPRRRVPGSRATASAPTHHSCHSHQPSDTEGGVTDVTTATKVSIKPLEDRVVVQANEAETTTASGLVIPDTAKEKPQEATVVAVGPGRIDDNGNRVPLDVNVGDVVIYSKYGGTEVNYGGEEYLVLSSRDLLAVVEK